jgi:hypothetical protein
MQRIPSEQSKFLTGALHTIALNGDYTFTQVTVKGRNTGNVTATIRPLLDDNSPANYHADDFEGVEDGAVNLGANPKKRTFTIDNKRLSALRLADDNHNAGSFEVFIKQWGRAVN